MTFRTDLHKIGCEDWSRMELVQVHVQWQEFAPKIKIN
jgi:hypothetical protein